MLSPLPMLQPDQILQNRYQIKQVLGHNAGRQTWRAEDLKAHKPVVVKLLTFSDRVQWDDLRLFEREAQVLKQLHHPRIPQYQDYFSIDDRLLWFGLVQDYIPGRSLKSVLTDRYQLTEDEAHAIARNVLKILIYLHGLNPPVLHRDIKPSNLIWGKDDAIYLVDFGAVQDRAAKEGATFTVVGTYGYAPLEQFGGRANPASDLYALGATLIHLLTGISPADLPQKNSRLQFAHLVNLNPGFARWLERLTEPNLERRFSSAHEALTALEKNEVASSAIAPFKPLKSSIQLRKTSEQLQITIPPGANKYFTIPVISGILLVMYFSLPSLGSLSYINGRNLMWMGIAGLVAIWMIVISASTTIVTFDSQQFEIRWQLFGFCLQHQKGLVSEIDHVFQNETLGGSFSEVILAAGVREHAFRQLGKALTPEECQWLVGEIKGWLGLQ